MWIFSKLEDLDSLIANVVRESVNLEYKRQMYTRASPEARRELLRDVSSIANAEGGSLIIGVEEDGDGVARALVPVPDAETEAARITSSCLANITERILGLTTTLIPVQGGEVIVVSIPRSYRRPHMITAEGANELWIRHDRQKSRMSIGEVRAAVTVTEELQMKTESFVASRLQSFRARSCALSISGTPLLLEEGRIDITNANLRELMQGTPAYRPGEATLADRRAVFYPTLRGVASVYPGSQELEAFRNGHVEFSIFRHDLVSEGAREGPGRQLRGFMVAQYVRNFTHFLEAFRGIGHIADPYLVLVAVFNCLGVAMSERGLDPWGRGRIERWQEGEEIVIGPVLTPPDESPDRTAQRMTDRFWNAFHFEHCPFFDAAGAFRISG